MSHFTVMVITDQKPTADMLVKTLQPWHEFECTGCNDEYIQEIETPLSELRADYEEHKEEGQSFLDFVHTWTGKPIVNTLTEEPDIEDENERWGWIELGEHGAIERVINRTNPNTKWDWWKVGGRWAGFFKAKSNAESPERGEPGLMGSMRSLEGVDMVRKGDIDIEAMEKEAEEKGTLWDEIRSAVGDLDDFVSWKETLKKYLGDFDAARTAFHKQRAMRAFKEWRDSGDDERKRKFMFIELEDFQVTRERYIEICRKSSIVPFAFIKEGKWVERGQMLMFGTVANESDKGTWADKVYDMIMSLPDDTWLTIIDCHI